ncbi:MULTISPECIES: hypothetical protein [Bradyrhizobium]|uniref:DUF5343 domain-containing protein n=1 Tax=Bradyrhizobium elkanii TaxID=29448 RepID=A0A4U6RVT9_BRAEL|nr:MULTISPECIES: hypothetical protein [Bradyrhizobium]MTV14923.1 hypothetical protein [Bradyrhizobium sp. BR2003]TKV79267.1 hypothetical protein FDV58_21765 [Bradyrhizobium elkanii]
MARARSPEYPAISLKEAVERVKMIYDKDYQNRLPKAVLAEHMGYKGLSGASLPVLSALTKFGLIEGRGDETRVSDLAVSIIAHPPGAPDRMAALVQAAKNADLFAELDTRFPDGKASDQAIRSYLLTNKFIPSAADAAIRAYRDTKTFVDSESGGYSGGQPAEPTIMTPASEPKTQHLGAPYLPPDDHFPGGHQVRRQEVITLDEGDVVLSFPADLSPESFDDLKAHLDLFIKKMQRRASTTGKNA